MALARVGTPAAPASQLGSNTPSVTPSWGTGQNRTAGNILYCWVTTWGGTTAGTPPTPSGWTLVTDTGAVGSVAQSHVIVFRKTAAGSDAAPTITTTNTGTATSSRLVTGLEEFSGADGTTPEGTTGTVGVTANPITVTSSGNVPRAGCYAFAVFQTSSSGVTTPTWAAGSGFTNSFNDSATSIRSHASLDVNASPANGSPVADAATTTMSLQIGAGVIIVVQPPSGTTSIAGTAAAASVASGKLAGPWQITGTAPTASAASGSFPGLRAITGTAAASSTAAGALSGTRLPISAAAFGTGSVNTATTMTAPAPAGVVLGDLLLIWATNGTSTNTYTVTAGSTGWSSAGPSTGSNSTATVFWKNADSTDVALSAASGSYTLTLSAGHSGEGIIVCAPGYAFDPSAPANAGQFAATASGSSYPATGLTTGNNGDTLMVFGMVRIATGTPAVMTLPSGFASFVAQANTTAVSSANVGVIAGTLAQATGGATGTQTVTAAANSAGGAFLIALTTGSAAPPAGTVVQQVAGAPVPAGFQVITKLTGATSVRLAISASSAMTSPTYVSAQTPDSLGYVRHTASGLSSATTYFYQAADTPSGGSETLTGPVGQCKTLPAAGTAASFTVALAACANANDALAPQSDLALLDLNAWNADLNIFTGDLDYSGTVSTVLATQVGVYETQIAHWAALGTLVSSHFGYYCRSDHESGPDNGDSNNTYTATNIAAAQQVFPFGVLGDTTNTPVHGLYQAWVVGRVRFIMIDVRNTDRSPGGNTDNSSKTYLGATQLAWLQSQLIQSEPLKVIVGDTAWMGTNSIISGPDKWWSYDTERQAIISYIAANKAAIGGLMYWHGDTHLVGATPPASNSWGGFPVYCAAPLVNDGGGLQQTTFTVRYNNASGECRQYGRISVTDTGNTITVVFQGWDAVNAVAQVTQTDVFVTNLSSGSAGNVSAAAGLLGGTAALGGPAASTSSAAGALSLTGKLAGTAVSGPVTGGALAGLAAATGTAAASTAASGTLAQVSALAGSAARVSTGAGTLTATSPLAGSAAQLSPAVGVFGASAIAGTSAAVSAGAGLLTALSPLAGSSAAVAAAAGTLAATSPLTGPAAQASTGTGILAVTGALAGAGVAASGASGALAATSALAGAAAAASATAGFFAGGAPLSGSAQAASAASGQLAQVSAAAGTSAALSAAAGTLSATAALTASSAGTSSAAGTFAAAGLAATVAVVSGAAGTLAGSSPLAGSAAAVTSAAGALARTSQLAGTSAGVSSAAGVFGAVIITGTAAAVVAASGQLGSAGALAGTAAAAVAATGALASAGALAGTAPCTAAAAGQLTIAGSPIDPMTATAARVSLAAGALTSAGALRGTAAPVSQALGMLAGAMVIAASAPTISAAAGQLARLAQLVYGEGGFAIAAGPGGTPGTGTAAYGGPGLVTQPQGGPG